MFIKKVSKKKFLAFNLVTKIYFFLSLGLLLIFTPIFFNTGVWINNKNNILNRIYFNGINNYSKIFEIAYVGSKKFFYDYKTLSLNIPYDNLLIIEENRDQLVKNAIVGGTFRRQNDEFKMSEASLLFNDQKYDVKIRLKGDRTSHFREKDKSSYKITIEGEDRFNGMRKFSLIKPRMRNYIHEWLFHEFASQGDLVKLKYEFVYLHINGSNQGLYVIEEGFDKDLVERSKRRNGPIFHVFAEFDPNVFNSKLEVFNKNYWNKKENIQVLDFAKKKLQNFIDGKSTSEETFDIKKWAWYYATIDLTYTYHGTDPTQVKLFYNPVNGLFEPIPYDGHRTNRNFSKHLSKFKDNTMFEIASSCLEKGSNCFKKVTVDTTTLMGGGNVDNLWVFSFFYNKDLSINKNFYKEYVKASKKLTDINFLNDFFENNKEKIERINSAIYSDYFFIDNVTYDKYGPGLYYFSKDDLFYRAKFLRDKINPQQSKIYITDDTKSIVFENKNPANHQLKISKIYCDKIELNGFNKIEYYVGKNLNFEKTTVKKNESLLNNTKCNFAEFLDLGGEKIIKKINFSPNISLDPKEKNKANFLKYFTQNGQLLELKEKETRINENIFIPKNYIVKIKSGEKIILSNNSFIHSFSPWKVGDNNGKVHITGDKNNFGGGIFISDSDKESIFINTEFSYLSGLGKKHYFGENYTSNFVINTTYSDTKINNYFYKKKDFQKKNYDFLDGRILYGALNFYNTKAKIKNSNFYRIDSEDGINFISSDYFVDGVSFIETLSDAIDVDFGKGIIKNSNFTFIGNDGIDLSGTNGQLENLVFKNVGDKIISVGENSDIKVNQISGENSYLGIASKDGSKTYLENIEFTKVKIPFASYIKKKSYDSGFIEVKKVNKLEKYLVKSLKDKNSKILIDGESSNNINENILNIIYKKKVNLINDIRK